MGCNERATYPTSAQTSILLDELDLHPAIAKGFLRTQNARLKARAFWQKMQIELNSIEGGAVKSWKQWMKYWSDKKSSTKKKARLLALNRRRGYNTTEVEVPLTETDKRIVRMLRNFEKTETFTKSQTSWRIPHLHETSNESNDQNVSELKEDPDSPKVIIIKQDSTESLEEPHDPDDSELGEGIMSPDPIFVNQEITIEEPAGADKSESPPRLKNSKQSPPHQPASTTNSPKRRKIWVRVPPPTDSQTQFVQISERFMQLEERRIDVESQNAALLRSLLERTAQREHTLLEALTNIGNGMIEHHAQQNRMMSEALRTLGEGLKALSRAINQ